MGDVKNDKSNSWVIFAYIAGIVLLATGIFMKIAGSVYGWPLIIGAAVLFAVLECIRVFNYYVESLEEAHRTGQ